MNQSIKIPVNTKSKIIGIIFVLVLFAAAVLCLLIFIFPAMAGLIKFKISVLIIIIALFCWTILLLLKQIIQTKTAFEINDNNLVDNSSPASVGVINWDDIIEIKEASNELRQKLLIFIVKNPQEYIEKTAKMSSMRKIYYKQFGSPIVIISGNLKYNYTEFINELNLRFDNFKKNKVNKES